MLKWHKDFYIGEGIKNPDKTKNKIEEGKLTFGIYLITLSDNPNNLLEIIPAAMLLQKSCYGLCPEIIGMTRGKGDAIDMVADIIMEIYRETGAFQVKEYFKNR